MGALYDGSDFSSRDRTDTLNHGTLNYPFSGGVRVGPDAFELKLDKFKTSELSEL